MVPVYTSRRNSIIGTAVKLNLSNISRLFLHLLCINSVNLICMM